MHVIFFRGLGTDSLELLRKRSSFRNVVSCIGFLRSFRGPEAPCSNRKTELGPSIRRYAVSAFEFKDSHALPSYRGEAANAATAVASILAADAGWETAREIASVHLLGKLLLR